MDNHISVSVIVPVYNVERYIERCTRSLMEQTMKDGIEFIFVNDCTPDSSISVLEETISQYPERKNQVKILHNKVNLGPSLTRKNGIADARGDYIAFCDSDDWVDPEMYQRMFSAAHSNNLDICLCRYIKETIHGKEESTLCYVGKHIWHEGDCKRPFVANLWSHLVRKDLLTQCIDRVFPCSYGEDLFLMSYVYLFSNGVIAINEPFYHYNLCNANSLMSQKTRTLKEWNQQIQNINALTDTYYHSIPNGVKLYHVVVNRMKFGAKIVFCPHFMSHREVYYTYKECHKDIMHFEDIPFIYRVKIKILYSCYPIYSFFVHKKVKRNDS